MSISSHVDKKATTDADSIDLDNDADTSDLVEAVTALASEVADLRQTVEDQQATIEDQQATIEEQQDTIESQQQTIEDLEDTVGMRGREVAQTRKQVHDVESRVEQVRKDVSEDVKCGVQTSETTMQEPCTGPQTDIEQMSRMPKNLLEDQTANVQRAVFVAKDVEAYTTDCPAGRVIKSSELRRVLQAGTDCAGHTQTVARVMDLLDRTGGDGTTVVERRGERRLVFEQDLVDRLSAQSQRCDSQPVEAT